MSVYYIAQMEILEVDKYGKNRDKSNELIRKYGGKVLAADSNFETLDGEVSATRIIVIEFPSEMDLRSWFYSPEYVEVRTASDKIVNKKIVYVHGR